MHPEVSRLALTAEMETKKRRNGKEFVTRGSFTGTLVGILQVFCSGRDPLQQGGGI